MAHRIRNPLWTRKRNQSVIKGSWQANGASEVSLIQGTGFAVTRSGTGEYTITFDNAFPEMVSANCTAQNGGAVSRTGQIGTFTPSAKTLIVRIIDFAGSVQDMVNNRVNFRAVMFNGTNGP